MLEEESYCMEVIDEHFNKDMVMTKQDEKSYRESKTCHICDLPFKIKIESQKKVRDHCHITGKYRGAAHASCNLNFK